AARQQSARSAEAARGVELYRQGKLGEAEGALRAALKVDKADADSWYHLGVVLSRAGKMREARKAFESAVKRRPGHADSHAGLGYTLLVANKLKEAERVAARAISLDARAPAARYTLGVLRLRQGRSKDAVAEAGEALRAAPDFAPAYLLEGQAYISLYADDIEAGTRARGPKSATPDPAVQARRKQYLEAAARSFEKYVELTPDSAESAEMREQLEALRVHASARVAGEPAAYTSDEVTTKAVVVARPEPIYTERARQEGVEGAIILRVVLASDGQVKHILVMRGLSHGLTENAIRAARAVRFIPATKDGRPVSQAVTIQYNFNIY
ncbi:MAG TPA: TonB family protein, partial [Pyrinomonadaceae bacterium]